jgi:acetylornithine deacetylase/succinyl-diaminopimelate desuccinylase-like protein
MSASTVQQRVLEGIDADELTAMAVDLINIPSPPGEEGAIADYLAQRLADLGLSVRFQEVEVGRNNVVGRLPGTGGGATLMFSGHFDTSTTGQEQATWGGRGSGSFGGGQARARVEDGWIHGLGASNMKGAFAAYWGAVRGLQRAGVDLAGDVLVTGLVGETERAPVDQYQGVGFRGGHVGARYLVSHGVTADFAIIGEPTGLRLQIGETGYCFARISVAGRSQHTWCKELGIDPIEKMMRVLAALKAWEPVFQQRHPHPTMETRVGIGAIQGGLPYKPSKCPAPFCNLYIDLRLLPGQSLMETRRELEEVLAEVGRDDPEFRADVELYLSGAGFELQRDEPLVQAVARAHTAVFEAPAPYAAPNRYAVSSDAGPMVETGIRALTYGPGGVATTGQFAMYDATQQLDEILGVDNLAAAARVYALAALDLCGDARRGSGAHARADAVTA